MKIIAGRFKGCNILVPKGIRPMGQRAKKSLFDIIQQEISDSRVLDLFSGSGALGIEALSRGAGQAVFVDDHRGCATTLKKNLALLKIGDQARIIIRDACAALRSLSAQNRRFDLVFLDPPYSRGLARKALQTIDECDIVSPRGLVIESCFYKDETISDYTHLSRVYSRHYGQTLISIYLAQDEKGTVSRNF